MSKKSVAGCKCIDDVQSQLKDMGATLVRHFQMDFKAGKSTMSPPSLEVRKLEGAKGKRLPTIICDHCPFCGKKYP